MPPIGVLWMDSVEWMGNFGRSSFDPASTYLVDHHLDMAESTIYISHMHAPTP